MLRNSETFGLVDSELQKALVSPITNKKYLFDKCALQALKVLKTSEFMPFVVFIAAPELETLRAMHKAVVDAGITTKLLTVSLISVYQIDFIGKKIDNVENIGVTISSEFKIWGQCY